MAINIAHSQFIEAALKFIIASFCYKNKLII